MVGSEVKELCYDGDEEDKNFEFKRLKNADDLEELSLRFNEIKVIEKIRHLKKLRVLDLRFNKIEDFQADCFNGLNLTELHLFNNKISKIAKL